MANGREEIYILKESAGAEKCIINIKPFQRYTNEIMKISISDLMNFVLNSNNIIPVFLLFQNYTLLTQNTVMPGLHGALTKQSKAIK